MKYKCLVLDHDDTVVESTATVHYPCFIKYLSEYRPSQKDDYTLSDYFNKNFHPGVVRFFRDEVGMDAEEMKREEQYWFSYVKSYIPTAFSGISDVLWEYVRSGGFIAINSHSYSTYIKRDFEYNKLPAPNVIYGWDSPKEYQKPSPVSIFELINTYGFKKTDIIVVDDLKPGYDMARSAGVDFAAAGWAYDVPEIEEFMRQSCDYYLKRVEDLKNLLLE